MSDGISRRAFLRGEFLFPDLDDESTDREDASGESADEGAEATGEGGEVDLPPESRGPAVELDAILDRAETIAGVGKRENETPHPHHQNRDDNAERGADDE